MEKASNSLLPLLSLFFFVIGAREWNETGVLILEFMVFYESAYGFELFGVAVDEYVGCGS
uniref:NADH:quinone oxidoreductase/Mrp antiporter membrane subunit domain-containing protein n=1 Tax=Salix viminalis TaxID=40686 RepID=A0A6N2NBN1_SALVM